MKVPQQPRRRGSPRNGTAIVVAASAAALVVTWFVPAAWVLPKASDVAEANSRRAVLSAGAGAVLGLSAASPDANAYFDFGPAMDNRGLDEIDVSQRKIVGDPNSENVKIAVKLLKDQIDKVDKAFNKTQEDAYADLAEFYSTPVGDLRRAVSEIGDIMDDRTHADVDRVGRIMLTAWYQVNGEEGALAGNAAMPEGSGRDYFMAILRRGQQKMQYRLLKYQQLYLEAATTLVKFVE
eukprot:TRINITY_DN124820_c0_g1_i1.p1 TRINITY_DN124820_c0_g1~~TRINITY_DN124820_c0_g1_i1.p1  ORF type:complete len:237 (+),score=57.37 TRINITY_DN124820_c0_g1_i1:90-800(+)